MQWTKQEKLHAKKVFDKALAASEKEILGQFSSLEVKSFDDLWGLEGKIKEWRNELAPLFDYRYSQLDWLIPVYLKRGWIEDDDLAGFSDDRRDSMIRFTKM